MAFFPSMSSKYYPNHANEKHPFMTFIVKVDTQSQWQKTVNSVLRRCHGVHSFRMDDNGVVEISGTVDPKLLLETLGKAGRSAEVTWLQFGKCSSNLFMQANQATPQDGRYLHAAYHSRPSLPSHRAIDNQSNGYDYGYDNHYYNTYGNKQDYYHDYHQHYGHMHNDFMQTNQATPRDGRYLHAAYHSRPSLPSHRAIDNQSNGYDYGYDNHYYNTYGNKQDYYHDYHQHYGHTHNDSQQSYEYEHEYGHGGNQIQSRSATRTRSGEYMSCCRVM